MRHYNFFAMNEQKKDLSLIDLLVICWHFLVKVFLFLVNIAAWCLRMLWQRKWVILSCVAVGLLIGYLDYSFGNKTSYVKSGFAINTHSKKPYFSIEEIRNLDLDKFAEWAGFTETQRKSILSIKPYYVLDLNDDGTIELIDYREQYKMEVDDEDANERNHNVWASKVFYVEVESMDKSLVPPLRQAIVDYLNESPVLQSAWEINLKYTQDCIDALNNEFSKIDSLQNMMLNTENFSSNLIERRVGATSTFGSGTYIQVLSRDKTFLKESIYKYQLALNDLQQGPIFCNTPINYNENLRSSLAMVLFLGAFQGLILGYMMVLIITHWKKIAAFFNKK